MTDHEVRLTEEMIDACRHESGAFTSITMRNLGVPVKPEAGWKQRIVGKMIKRSDYERAFDGRLITRRDRKKMKQSQQSTLL